MSLSKKIILFLFFLLLLFVAHTLITTGFFRNIEPNFEGKILKKIPLKGAEDITISHSDSFAIVSATNRQVYPPQEEEKGGLYFIDLKNRDYKPNSLTENFNRPFAPHGISIFKKDSTYLVMAINHTDKGESIEVFELWNTTLSHLRTFTDPAMVRPNDIVIVDENNFYFTNDHGYTSGIMKLLEEYGGLRVSNVIYSNGTEYREVAEGIAYANGINYDPKRNLLFVASPRDFMVKVYDKEADGSLNFIEDISCGTGVDNIEFDEASNLWIGAHPDLLHFSAYAKGKKETSPSEIIKINYRGKEDYDIEQIYKGNGEQMSGSTVAAVFGDQILVGNVMDEHFLVLEHENTKATDSNGSLETKLKQLADTVNGKLGIHALHIETSQSASLNGKNRFPMQSVYKFPIAMIMLQQVDKGKFSLEDTVWISPSEYIPAAGHSPIRDQYPKGVSLSIESILEYNVSRSDGTACDVLLRLLGGTNKVQEHLEKMGIENMVIATTEMVQVANDTIQYQNWSTPEAMNKLFSIFHEGQQLKPESRALLMKYLSVSNKWFDKRIKGLLPKNTPTVHKTGSSRTINGFTRATNDAGIVTLPDGSHLAISIFLSDAYHSQSEREWIIAEAAKTAYDYHTSN